MNDNCIQEIINQTILKIFYYSLLLITFLIQNFLF